MNKLSLNNVHNTLERVITNCSMHGDLVYNQYNYRVSVNDSSGFKALFINKYTTYKDG